MGADLAHLAVVQHDNPVGIADRRETVGDQETGAFAHDFFPSVLNQPSLVGVKIQENLQTEKALQRSFQLLQIIVGKTAQPAANDLGLNGCYGGFYRRGFEKASGLPVSNDKFTQVKATSDLAGNSHNQQIRASLLERIDAYD
jgi:hypothetical protein